MGELFRRFWLPVALAEELPGADCVPLRVKVLNEDLIAFRGTDGRVGLIDAYCPHRGAPLFFGRNEENGLRCVYHGWKFDVDGVCTDLPNAPEGDTFKDKIKVKYYPAVEAGDLIWAFMGPADKKPPMPEFEWLHMPSSHRYVSKFRLECNYLQAMEGDYDPGECAVQQLREVIYEMKKLVSQRKYLVFGVAGGLLLVMGAILGTGFLTTASDNVNPAGPSRAIERIVG